MADECGSSGLEARVAFDTSATGALGNFTAADPAFALAGSTNVSLKRQHVNNEGTTGRTTQSSELTRAGLDIVDGSFPFLLTPDLLGFLGPHITGNSYVGFTTYPAVATPPKFHAMLHRDAALYVYTDMFVNTFTVGSTSGETVNAGVDVVGAGREEVPADPSNWPTGLETSKSIPYMHHDVVISINGTTFDFRSWSLKYNANLQPVYFGSTKPCGFKRSALTETTLQLVGKHTSATIGAMLNAAAPPNKLDILIALTHPNPSYSTSFRCQGTQIPPVDPSIAGAGEILLDLTGTCRSVDGGDSEGAELIIYNDNL